MWLKKIPTEPLIILIRAYQKTLSPDHGFFGSVFASARCRFYPTCSSYAVDSLRQYGLLKGIVAAFSRVSRCSAFHLGGFDPVGSGLTDRVKSD